MSTDPVDPEPGSVPVAPSTDEAQSGLPGAPAELSPQFPGEERGTGAVLYGAGPGTMHVHWRLDQDVWAQVAGSFPADSARPEPVVRLRRIRAAGGSEQMAEIGLLAVAREGVGEAEFRVAVDHGRYLAELGLTRSDGGWLLLARSNEADNVAAVRVDLAGLVPAVQPVEVDPELPEAEPALARTIQELASGGFPLVQGVAADGGPTRTSPLAAITDGDGPLGSVVIPPLIAVTGVGDAVVFHASSRAIKDGDESHGSAAIPPLAIVPARVGGEGDAVVYLDLPGRPVHLAGQTAPVPSGAGSVSMGPIEPLAYGQAPAYGGVVQIDAELRISGQAPPGTEIDLFGQPYRVGPGGRFQLVLRVDDVDLLRRALAQHCPPELTRHRDD